MAKILVADDAPAVLDVLDDVLYPWFAAGKPLAEVLARYFRHLRP